MNPRTRILRPILELALAALVVTALAPAQAAGAVDTQTAPLPLQLGAGSTVWLEGTSTMHDFESRTRDFKVRFLRDAAAKDPADVAGLDQLIRSSAVCGLDVDIPVVSLKSGKTGLDKNLQKTLKAEKYPAIHFHLGHYTLAAGSDTSEMHAQGTLTVAGHEQATNLTARTWRSGQGVWIEGVQPLRMSDFEVKPPTMMLGTLKVGDRVTVHYRLLLVPGNTGPEAGSSN